MKTKNVSMVVIIRNKERLTSMGVPTIDTGGMVAVFNKTGESVVQLLADEKHVGLEPRHLA